MKVISLWQPYASLLVLGFKLNETRPYPCRTLIGQRLGIASTASIKPEQRALFADERFQHYYQQTGLPELEDLPRGQLLGTVLIHSCSPVAEEDLDDITEEEQLYGDYGPNRFVWRTRDPEVLAEPVPIIGKQGIFNLHVAEVLVFDPVAQKR